MSREVLHHCGLPGCMINWDEEAEDIINDVGSFVNYIAISSLQFIDEEEAGIPPMPKYETHGCQHSPALTEEGSKPELICGHGDSPATSTEASDASIDMLLRVSPVRSSQVNDSKLTPQSSPASEPVDLSRKRMQSPLSSEQASTSPATTAEVQDSPRNRNIDDARLTPPSETNSSGFNGCILNIETLEGAKHTVILCRAGYKIVSNEYNKFDKEIAKKNKFYETIYALLSAISPKYTKRFHDAIAERLEDHAASNNPYNDEDDDWVKKNASSPRSARCGHEEAIDNPVTNHHR